jgi:hypothetical protein
MLSHRIDYFTNLVSLLGDHKSYTYNNADPTRGDKYEVYLKLNQGFENPEAGKHNGEVCEECGATVENDRCFCTDHNYPTPNVYHVIVDIPCWMTLVEITAASGETYSFNWNNEPGDKGAWKGSNGEQAEKMLDYFLCCAERSNKYEFENVDPCNTEDDDFTCEY